MKTLKSIGKKLKLNQFWQEESAQGMTEYILLVVVVVGLAYTFRGRIQEAITGKMGQVSSEIGGFEVQK